MKLFINTMRKHIYKIKWVKTISLFKFVYYNFFCNSIHREKGVYLIPYKGAVIDLHYSSKIFIYSRNIQIGCNSLKGSRTETYVRLGRNAKWISNNGCLLNYGATIEVNAGGTLCSGFTYINTGSVIIANKNIQMGDDIWIGRNCYIYDSDFHSMLNEEGVVRNHSKQVVIGNHVWITNNAMITKGVKIEGNSVISPFTVVKKDVPFGTMITNGAQQIIKKDNVKWSNKKPD